MKLAFLILNHREPAQLSRLIVTLRRELPDCQIVVHHDSFGADVAAADLAHVPGVHLLTSDTPISWGDYSLAEACRRSIAWMVDNLDFDWLSLLSAQDYPIRSLGSLGHYLASTGADALIDAVPLSQLQRPADRRNRRRRYYYQYRPVRVSRRSSTASTIWPRIRQSTALLVDVLNNIQPYMHIYKYPDRMPWRIGFRAAATPFTQVEPCWFGSTWCSLSYRAALVVARAPGERPDLIKYFQNTIIADESLIHTIVCNRADLRIQLGTLHHIRWTEPKSGHPDLLGIAHLPELIDSPLFFARKFDLALDSDVLDRLDDHLKSSG